MAVLSEQDRVKVWANFMGAISTTREECGVSKSELRAAVNALDQFLDDNAGALNSAIPQPARANLTVAQKARLLAFVALRRWGGN